MVTGMVAFVAGVGLLQLQSVLPDIRWVLLAPLLLLVLLRLSRFGWLWMSGLGFLWALYSAHAILSPSLDPALEGRDVLVEGVISALPEQQNGRARFELDVERLLLGGRSRPPPGRVRLGWYTHAGSVLAGERWRLLVRLKQPHGFFNQGGFDYEGWLFRRRIRATGYVRTSLRNRLLDHDSGGYRIDRMRQTVKSRISGALQGSPTTGLVLALAIGDRSGLDAAQWRAFTRTGTSHLIAISGLHIGIVSAWVLFLFRRLWARSERLVLWCPAPRAAAMAALTAAAGYAALAGFAVPTQRALIMLVVALGGILLRRNSRPLPALAAALFLVVLFDPFALLSVGFWLSFGAVAVILYSLVGRLSTTAPGWQWGRIQWVVAIGLFPLLLLSGGQAVIAAPLVNLVAVPWFSLVIVPLVLLGTLLVWIPGLGPGLLKLAAGLLGWSVQLLETAGHWSGMVFVPGELPGWVWLAALAGVSLLLAPRGLPGRWLGLLLWLPLGLVRPPAPGPGEVWLRVLDVGQGLSVVIRTRAHTLVYDTGARFSPRFDAGSAVLVPYLRARGISRVDRLVLSNGDNDHAGGAAGLLADIPVFRVLGGEVGRLHLPGRDPAPCVAGTGWTWDGVDFQMLHPDAAGSWQGNDASCVLRVENGSSSILLAGDIEAPVETWLEKTQAVMLKADIVVVPHHGSETSSTPRFVAAVAPEFAVCATGYGNRYGFPKPAVVARWEQAGARVLDTARAGSVGFRILADGRIEGPALARREARRYWTHAIEKGASRQGGRAVDGEPGHVPSH